MALYGYGYHPSSDKLDNTMKLTQLFQPKPRKPPVDEITTYVNDLETMSIMRDKAEKNGQFDEAALHTETIKVMQLCLQHLLDTK